MTPKQKAFCDNYAKTRNGAESARRAGYSVHTARIIASENLKKDECIQYLNKIGLNSVKKLEENRRDVPHFVYFIDDGEFIKIGMTIDVAYRIQQLQAMNPHPLSLYHSIEFPSKDDALDAETDFHRNLKKSKAHGEWFYRNDVIDFLKEMIQ